MASDVQIVNYGLTLLGESRILSLDDDVKPAREAKAVYSMVRDALLAGYNWSFAKTRAQLAVSSTPPAFEFSSAYPLPTDCLRLLFIGDHYVGADLTDYRGSPVEEYEIEAGNILTRRGSLTSTVTSSVVTGGDLATLSVTDTGYGYWTVPTVTVSGGGGSGATATVKLKAIGWIQHTFGAGFTVGDLLTPVGGTYTKQAKFRVTAAPGGVGPSTAVMIDPGEYSVLPGVTLTSGGVQWTTVDLTGGTGAGAQIDILWGITNPTITANGSGYTTTPAVVVSGGSGQFQGTLSATVNPVVVVNTSSSGVVADPLNIKYIKRITDPEKFSPNFATVLGCRMAEVLAEAITQSSSKRDLAITAFADEIKIAIRANAIELPPQRLPDDDWMISRL